MASNDMPRQLFGMATVAHDGITGSEMFTKKAATKGDYTLKKQAKNAIKAVIRCMVNLSGNTQLARFILGQIASFAMEKVIEISHVGVSLKFATPNSECGFRVKTFATKEPETLDWIDLIPEGAVLWDVGANIGLYSVYAAKKRNCRVWAFEPSVFNLELLARNIFLNELTEQITIVPLPLSDKLAVNKLHMTSTNWGGALSTFGQEYGHDGKPINKIFEFPTIGISMIDAVELLKIAQPDYIKMDVDGIEHLILKGGMPVLSKVKGILIEINDKFTTQANDTSMYLQQAGFFLKEKKHAEIFEAGMAQYTFNQIWAR